MAPLVWGVVVLASVALLQVPVAYWLGQYFTQEESPPPAPTTDLPVSTEAYDREPGVCPRCGTRNDPEFAYCGNCISPLGRLPER